MASVAWKRRRLVRSDPASQERRKTTQHNDSHHLSTCMSDGRAEIGSLEVEGHGSWTQWVDTDPARLQRLFQGAVDRLAQRWPDCVEPTDSDDGTETKNIRREAHKKRVLAAFSRWHDYGSYRTDFEAASDSDPILAGMRERMNHVVSPRDLREIPSEVIVVISAFLYMHDVLKFLSANKGLQTCESKLTAIIIDIHRNKSFRGYPIAYERFQSACRLDLYLPTVTEDISLVDIECIIYEHVRFMLVSVKSLYIRIHKVELRHLQQILNAVYGLIEILSTEGHGLNYLRISVARGITIQRKLISLLPALILKTCFVEVWRISRLVEAMCLSIHKTSMTTRTLPQQIQE